MWQVADTARAVFAVEAYEKFIKAQAESALRHVATTHPYDEPGPGETSLRGGTVAGEHAAIWFGQNERIEIRHTAENREIFALGACRLAAWLAGRPAGVHTVQQFLDDILHTSHE